MAILAVLPIFGIGLAMIPTALILMVDNRIGEGIFLFIFYMILSCGVEYIAKPKMVGTQAQMHTLLVVPAIIGGLSVYGILGIIYGPLTITAFLTLSKIYLKKIRQMRAQRQVICRRTIILCKIDGDDIPARHLFPFPGDNSGFCILRDDNPQHVLQLAAKKIQRSVPGTDAFNPFDLPTGSLRIKG